MNSLSIRRSLSIPAAICAAVVLLFTLPLMAQDEPTAVADQSDESLTVAVLDFDAGDVPIDALGDIVSQTITIMLTGESGIDIVDRMSMEQTLAEHSLNLTGLVDTNQAVKVGNLVGARILVVGRVFQLGNRTFITAKLIGTETSRVDGVLVQGDADTAIDELVMELAARIGERIKTAGPKLVSSSKAVDPLPDLKEALKGRDLPRMAVVITEEHISPPDAQHAPDPAAETEVKKIMLSVGVQLQDVASNDLAEWANAKRRGANPPWPQELHEVDMVITGAAFSELAAQLGNLHSATGRVEINLIDRKTGKILVAERATTRAVDLAESIAGKNALEKGGRAVAIEVLHYLNEHLPEADRAQD